MKAVPMFLLCGLLGGPALGADLVVPGAGPPTRLLQLLAAEFNAGSPTLRVEVPPSTGMSGALDAVRSGSHVLARMPRRLSAEELRSGLSERVIAREAIVFAVGARVDLDDLPRARLADIFAGRLTDWSELGAAPGPIRVFYRESGEAALQVIRSRLPEFAALQFTPQGRLLNLDHEVIDQLERFGWGIGWGSAGNVRGAGKGVRALALDGVKPTAEALASGRYPLFSEVVLIYRGDNVPAAAREFVAFVGSPSGRALVSGFGAVPP